MTPGEDSKAMRQWKKQKEYEERYNKRFRALDVGVVRGKKASEEWLPNFGGVWNSGPRSENRSSFHNERMEGKKMGKESVVSSLNSFILSDKYDSSLLFEFILSSKLSIL